MRRFRNRMIMIVFLALVSVFAVITVVVNIAVSLVNTYQEDSITRLIAENNGEMPKLNELNSFDVSENVKSLIGFNEESVYRTRYFTALMGDLSNVQFNFDHIVAISVDEGSEMVQKAHSKKSENGYINRFRYGKYQVQNGEMIVFLDCSDSFRTLNMITVTMVVISVLLTLIVTLVVIMFSNRVLQPFEENAKRQKQFITDASHELKTPLAIISANSEVLQYKTGENQWTQNIINQTKRMGELINQLLILAKSEEIEVSQTATDIDYTELVKDSVETFNGILENKKVRLNTKLDKVTIHADYEQIKQLLSIILENASKYVEENGEIDVKLKNGERNAVLDIANTAEIPDDFDFKRLFDRFYRPDEARTSSQGGYGIGLSVAQNIASQHGGNIKARKVEDKISFVITLPTNMKRRKVKNIKK